MKSAGPRGLVGTDVLRAFRRGDQPALDFIDEMARRGQIPVSQLSAMTLTADAPDGAERAGLRHFFSWCLIHSLAAKIVRRAQAILETLPTPSPLTADDAIVAATAIEHKLPLYTLDPARFAAVAGLTATPPY